MSNLAYLQKKECREKDIAKLAFLDAVDAFTAHETLTSKTFFKKSLSLNFHLFFSVDKRGI